VFIEGHDTLFRELVWFGIAAPIFGGACALLAKSYGRRQWVWFILGFFFTASAIIVLAFLCLHGKRANSD
jgi:hypothetical protein